MNRSHTYSPFNTNFPFIKTENTAVNTESANDNINTCCLNVVNKIIGLLTKRFNSRIDNSLLNEIKALKRKSNLTDERCLLSDKKKFLLKLPDKTKLKFIPTKSKSKSKSRSNTKSKEKPVLFNNIHDKQANSLIKIINNETLSKTRNKIEQIVSGNKNFITSLLKTKTNNEHITSTISTVKNLQLNTESNNTKHQLSRFGKSLISPTFSNVNRIVNIKTLFDKNKLSANSKKIPFLRPKNDHSSPIIKKPKEKSKIVVANKPSDIMSKVKNCIDEELQGVFNFSYDEFYNLTSQRQ